MKKSLYLTVVSAMLFTMSMAQTDNVNYRTMPLSELQARYDQATQNYSNARSFTKDVKGKYKDAKQAMKDLQAKYKDAKEQEKALKAEMKKLKKALKLRSKLHSLSQ